jgi:transposase
MQEKLRFLGLDVHAETIAVAIAESDGEVRSLGTIPNRADSLRKLIKKLGPAEKLTACYLARLGTGLWTHAICVQGSLLGAVP